METIKLLKLEDDVIAVKSKADILKAAELLETIGIPVFGSEERKTNFIEKGVEIESAFLVQEKDGSWRTQSHYIGWGTSIEDLEKAITKFKGTVPAIIKDIEGRLLSEGNWVWYSKLERHGGRPELIKTVITKITKAGNVKMGDLLCSRPDRQLLKLTDANGE